MLTVDDGVRKTIWFYALYHHTGTIGTQLFVLSIQLTTLMAVHGHFVLQNGSEGKKIVRYLLYHVTCMSI